MDMGDVPWETLDEAADEGERRLTSVWRGLWTAVLAALPSPLSLTGLLLAIHTAWETAGVPLLQAQVPAILDALQEAGALVSGAPADVRVATIDLLQTQTDVRLTADIQRAFLRALDLVAGVVLTGGLPLVALPDILLLTGPQVRTLERQWNAWTEDGLTEEHRLRVLRQQADRMVRTRQDLLSASLTETALATGAQTQWEAAVQQGAVRAMDVRRFWRIRAGACPLCAEIPARNPDGRGLTEAFQTALGSVMQPGLHPRCVTGDTLVTPGGRIAAVSQRTYSGEVLLLRCAGGQLLTCTPNHPILTPHGWMAAHLLRQGDNVLCGFRQQGIAARNPEIDDYPILIEQIAQTARLALSMPTIEVPIADEAFHGDGRGSEVAIIWANSILRDGFQPKGHEHIMDELFSPRAESLCVLGSSAVAHPFPRILFPPRSMVGRLDLRGTLCRRHLLPMQRIGSTTITGQDLRMQQSSPDRIARDAIILRNSLLRHAIVIQAQELIKVQHIAFTGHVYNLQTADEWYIGNGIITHNCRCWLSYGAQEQENPFFTI